MNTLNYMLLAKSNGGDFSMFFMIIAMVVIFYFFMIRPQNKKQKQIKEARAKLDKGSKVVTAGGIYGRITKVSETTFMIEVAPGTEIRVEKNSVYPLVEDNGGKKQNKEDKKEIKESKAKTDEK